ncbi:MAG: 4-hydroxy-tetrahydrodipicolinate reductase [Pirellulaceae bacterium]|nr:MAG: 4-hydroxy-tetrahydrodipicolinate reductase [Pirellulaceae bacterium]
MTIRLAVYGAGGRMGRRVIALAANHPHIQPVAAVEHDAHPDLGTDAGLLAGVGALQVPLSSHWPADVDVVIDFSTPTGCQRAVEHCAAQGIPLVIATTGLNEEQQRAIQDAAKGIAICWAPNMSLAVNLTMRLAEQAAAALKDVPGGVDVEIIETHHRFKEDAPSGTALKFGELIAKQIHAQKHVHGRHGQVGPRSPQEIGYHAVRAGDDPGQHTILFGMLGEKIELRVAASNRDCYASGALAAAEFLVRQPPGLYSMFDVLGLKPS